LFGSGRQGLGGVFKLCDPILKPVLRRALHSGTRNEELVEELLQRIHVLLFEKSLLKKFNKARGRLAAFLVGVAIRVLRAFWRQSEQDRLKIKALAKRRPAKAVAFEMPLNMYLEDILPCLTPMELAFVFGELLVLCHS
jgi:hypothetical protein